MRSSLRSNLYPVAAAVLAFAMTGRAEATPMQLTLTAYDVTTHTYYASTFTDAATPDVISVSSGIEGAIRFTGEFSQAITAGTTNALTTAATTVTNISSTDTYILTAAVSAQNFFGPDNRFTATGSGTWLRNDGSMITLEYYVDPSNVLGGQCTTATPRCEPLTDPGDLIDSFTSPAASGPTSSYSYNPGTTMLSLPDSGPYSMTEVWTYTLRPHSELTSRGQTETTTFVPEPASILIIGIGLLGLGSLRGRWKPV